MGTQGKKVTHGRRIVTPATALRLETLVALSTFVFPVILPSSLKLDSIAQIKMGTQENKVTHGMMIATLVTVLKQEI